MAERKGIGLILDKMKKRPASRNRGWSFVRGGGSKGVGFEKYKITKFRKIPLPEDDFCITRVL